MQSLPFAPFLLPCRPITQQPAKSSVRLAAQLECGILSRLEVCLGKSLGLRLAAQLECGILGGLQEKEEVKISLESRMTIKTEQAKSERQGMATAMPRLLRLRLHGQVWLIQPIRLQIRLHRQSRLHPSVNLAHTTASSTNSVPFASQKVRTREEPTEIESRDFCSIRQCPSLIALSLPFLATFRGNLGFASNIGVVRRSVRRSVRRAASRSRWWHCWCGWMEKTTIAMILIVRWSLARHGGCRWSVCGSAGKFGTIGQ
jgi:hypothetical protein